MRDLSVIIPAYNEAERIGPTLESIAGFLAERDLDDEVIVVDDGSTDETVAVVESYRSRFRRLVVLESERNIGKGHAVRRGMITGTGRHRLFLDADNSTDVREFDRLIAAASAEPIEPAVIIGSVAVEGAAVAVRQPGLRPWLGRLANRLIQALVLPGIEDTQRGFKVFTGEASDAIFRRCRTDGWAFDVEALAFARALGYHVLEVPVTWEHREDSRVRPSAYFTTMVDVARIARRVNRETRSSRELASDDDRADLSI
ncbi:MAG: dolichyl-phosphate beta-glucosyltransferase [Acidimicrobiales bacterium]